MKIVITGGAGFIGSNAAAYFLQKGASVVVFDNLSRNNTDKNLLWLQSQSGNFQFVKGDVRIGSDVDTLLPHMREADAVLHLAAQVAVTTSVVNPAEDFAINALGTFHVLEVLRKSKSNAKFIYSSTNKVYGGMEEVEVVEKDTRYAYKTLVEGVSEKQNLDFHSPYGCSKGAADQYVHDYARIYNLDTVVLRQSCIYGPRQFGIEDQGWVAWFIIATYLDKKLSIYGDGKQVRDLLYIDDLVNAYECVIQAKDKTKGKIYNIGGGTSNTLSVWSEFKPILEKLFRKKISVNFQDWRPGDQKIFVSDIQKAKNEFGWVPKTSVIDGIEKLFNWVGANKSLFA